MAQSNKQAEMSCLSYEYSIQTGILVTIIIIIILLLLFPKHCVYCDAFVNK